MMKPIKILTFAAAFTVTVASCVGSEPPESVADEGHPSDIGAAEAWPSYTKSADPLWQRHHASPLKILAIGNSFTINSLRFMPELVNALNADSVCVAMLTRGGGSLGKHWTYHTGNIEKYEFVYSDGGKWNDSRVKTIDEALSMMDWDIITLQQDSGNSGDYTTYQPYLDNLTSLFRATNPDAKIVWHVTWSYAPGAQLEEFSKYDYDWKKMYDSIIEAASKAIEYCDMSINSALLLKGMRATFPEVTDGFSSDGRHVTDATAQFALSNLWHEALIGRRTGTSSLCQAELPYGINAEIMNKTDSIIKEALKHPLGGGTSSVPMLRE